MLPLRGLLLWFVVDDFAEAWRRAQQMCAPTYQPMNLSC